METLNTISKWIVISILLLAGIIFGGKEIAIKYVEDLNYCREGYTQVFPISSSNQIVCYSPHGESYFLQLRDPQNP